MADLQSFNIVDQCAAVAMLTENAATQIRKYAENPEDSGQLVTMRKACNLAHDTLEGFVARLPKKGKAR